MKKKCLFRSVWLLVTMAMTLPFYGYQMALAGDANEQFRQSIQDISTANKWLSGLQLSVDRLAENGEIVLVTNTNYQDVIVENNQIVYLDDTISLTGSYNKFNHTNLQIRGGGFTGNGTEEVDLGTGTIVIGSTFQDVQVDGTNITFINCSFQGAIALPWEAVIQSSQFNTATISTKIESIYNSEINNCTLGRVNSIVNSEINNSFVTTYKKVIGNKDTDDTVFDLRSGIFSQNGCDNCKINITNDSDGQIIISNNNFDDCYPGENEIIHVEADDSSWKSFIISDNNFIVQSGTPRSILITGTPTGSYQMLKIAGNSFLKGDYAISYVGNFETFVFGNLTRGTTLGVTDNGTYRKVEQNYHF